MSQALAWCREARHIGVVILNGAGDKAFCSGGDMNVKGARRLCWRRRRAKAQRPGCTDADTPPAQARHRNGNGYAIGGGHVLHLVCDPHHSKRQCHLRDRAKGGLVRRSLRCKATFARIVGRRKPARYGLCAVSTVQTRLSAWAWSTKWCPSSALRTSV